MANGRKRARRRSGIGRARRPLVAALRIAGEGVTEIAKQTGVSKGVIYATLEHPEVVALIEAAHRETRTRVVSKLAALQTEGLDALAAIARGKPDGEDEPVVPVAVRRQAWTDLLDRAGVSRTERSEMAISARGDASPAHETLADFIRRVGPDNVEAELRAVRAEDGKE